MEQGQRARAALDRDHGKGGAHFEGGGDGRSPATRTAGSGRHAVTGTARGRRHGRGGVGSGRHAATGTTRTAGSGMPAMRTTRAHGGDDVGGGGVDGEVEQPDGVVGGGGGNWRCKLKIFTSVCYIVQALVPVGGMNRD